MQKSTSGWEEFVVIKVLVTITLKPSVLDPQGSAIQKSLHTLGFDSVKEVRMGKYLEVYLDTHSQSEAEKQIAAMCEQLLANPVIESYSFTMEEISQ